MLSKVAPWSYGSVYAGGSPRLPHSCASSILCIVPFCSNAHTLPFALGSGFVAQKNMAFAVLLNVRSVSPCPVVANGLLVQAPPLVLLRSEKGM